MPQDTQRSLSAAEARDLIADANPNKPLDLRGWGPLTVEAAEALAQWPGAVMILSAWAIDAEAAVALTGWQKAQAILYLYGADALTSEAAEALIQWRAEGAAFCLRDMATPSAALIEVFCEWSGGLWFGEIEALDVETAAALGRWSTIRFRPLNLSRIRHLSLEIAEALCPPSEVARALTLSGLRGISAEVAAALCRASSKSVQLKLDGLEVLTPEIAAAFKVEARRVDLNLNGLRALDAATARALYGLGETAQLSLLGLEALPGDVIEAMCAAPWREICLNNDLYHRLPLEDTARFAEAGMRISLT